MVDELRSWAKENSGLLAALATQAAAFVAAVLSMTAYMVRLEERVSTLEIRGSPHLAIIENRLTGLEAKTETNAQALERVKDKLTK